MGCLRCCAGGWYLLSGGDGDPPDAVHVGRVSVGELRGGEVALAVLERLPTGCEGDKGGGQSPGKPPQHRDGWHCVRSSRCPQPPCSLLPPKFPAPSTALQKKTPSLPRCSNPKKPQTSPGAAGDAPGTPSQAPCPPSGHQTRGAGAIPCPPPLCHATPRGPGSPPGLRAGLRGRGWIRPSVAIWKPHDAAAVAHGVSLWLLRGQSCRPLLPPTRRQGGRTDREMKGEILKKKKRRLETWARCLFSLLALQWKQREGKARLQSGSFFWVLTPPYSLKINHFSCSRLPPRSPAAPERGTAGCRGPSQRRLSSRLLISCWN